MGKAMRGGGWVRGWTASVMLLAAFGCGDDDGGSSVTCGEGTKVVGDQCLPNGVGTDGGTQAQPDSSAACGAGTVLMNGSCVVDSTKTLSCGPGTVAQGTVCVLGTAALPSIKELSVSHVAVRSQGTLAGDGDKLSQYYPVEVSVGLTYTGDKADVPVVFALGGVPQAGQDTAPFCLVGGVTVAHPGGTKPTEAIASGVMYVPKGCLDATEQSRIVSPLVFVDPDNTVGISPDPDAIHSVAFAKANADLAEVAACRRDSTPNGAQGTCAVNLTLEKSPGLDFDLSELTLESAVAVLDRCGDDWTSIANGSAAIDLDRPASYRCNKNIVPEFKRDAMNEIVKDEAGAPVQATYTNDQAQTLPKFVYGAADISANVTVITHGENGSKVTSADQALAANGDDSKLLNNALAAHGLQIVYSIRPAKADTSAWKPLYLHAEGEQAKAGEEAESGQVPTQFEETEAVPETPQYYTHGLYVENDCGERNLSTCDAGLNPRTDIIYGAWKDETDFVMRACLAPVNENGTPDTALDVDPRNDCKEIPLKLVRHDTSGSSANASSYGFNYQWKNGVGSDATLKLGWDFHTFNNLDTSGVTVDNEGSLSLGSKLIGSTDILRGGAEGAAYVSLVGSYYDYGLSAFGTKLWGDSREVPEYHYEKDWSASKELKKSMRVQVGPIPVTVEIIFTGTAGLVANVDIVAVNAPYTASEESGTFLVQKAGSASRIGLATLTVTPYGNMNVVARASVDNGAIRFGVAGQLVLLDLSAPLSGRVWWGVTNLNPVQLTTGAWADLTLRFSTMDGRIYLFAEQMELKICSKKTPFGRIKYPCGTKWDTFWDMTIADWDGWTWKQTLWSSPYKAYTLP